MCADLVLSKRGQKDNSMYRTPPQFQVSGGRSGAGNGGSTGVCLCKSSSCKLKMNVLYALNCMHSVPEF